jgi:hypothetical protein
MFDNMKFGNIKIPQNLKLPEKIGEETQKYKRGCITAIPIVALIVATILYLIVTNIKWITLGIVAWVLIILLREGFYKLKNWIRKKCNR